MVNATMVLRGAVRTIIKYLAVFPVTRPKAVMAHNHISSSPPGI